ALKADARLDNFDTGPLQFHTLEARLNLTAQLTSRATSLDKLADGMQGRVQLTSKGGITRFLAVTDDNAGLVQSAASAGASVLGTVVGVVAGGSAGGSAA